MENCLWVPFNELIVCKSCAGNSVPLGVAESYSSLSSKRIPAKTIAFLWKSLVCMEAVLRRFFTKCELVIFFEMLHVVFLAHNRSLSFHEITLNLDLCVPYSGGYQKDERKLLRYLQILSRVLVCHQCFKKSHYFKIIKKNENLTRIH